jgi:hypothetical protein
LIKTYKADINIQMNFGANRRGNQEQEIQRHSQQWTQSTMDTRQNKTKQKQNRTQAKQKHTTLKTKTMNNTNPIKHIDEPIEG